MSWKISLSVISEILGLFVNTLAAEDKYSLRNWENLCQPIQMPLSQVLNCLCQFSAVFLKSTSNFKTFEKEHEPHSLCFSEISDCERCRWLYD